jgi:hypothetical protein
VSLFMLRGHTIESFVHVGAKFALQSRVSPYIHAPSGAPAGDAGYDGQFVYYIAVDPASAPRYMDAPTYRYTRILYPALARLLTLGQPALVPAAMLLINLVAVAGGTLAVAAWLARHQVSPWLALSYAFFPGMFNALQSDLTEPLAYGLVAASVLLMDRGRVQWPALIFAMAALTRETTVLFPLILGVRIMVRPAPPTRRRDGALLVAAAVVPLTALKVGLRLWLGSWGLNGVMEHVPFQGILDFLPWHTQQLVELIGVAAPGLICLVAAAWMLGNPSYFSYVDSGRASIAVVLPALYAAGVQRASGNRAPWLAAALVLWLSVVPIGLLLPHSTHVFKL